MTGNAIRGIEINSPPCFAADGKKSLSLDLCYLLLMFVGTELEKYQMLVQKHSLQSFAEEHNGLYLLGSVAEDSPSGILDFYTGVINLDEATRESAPRPNPTRQTISPGAFLVKIVKKQPNAWTKWLSVGRTNNNDIVIRHPSVSKFHARLDTQGPLDAACVGESCLWITDKGSTKGTTVNGKPLENAVRYPLQLEDRVTFGEVEMTLLDAATLYHRLSIQRA